MTMTPARLLSSVKEDTTETLIPWNQDTEIKIKEEEVIENSDGGDQELDSSDELEDMVPELGDAEPLEEATKSTDLVKAFQCCKCMQIFSSLGLLQRHVCPVATTRNRKTVTDQEHLRRFHDEFNHDESETKVSCWK